MNILNSIYQTSFGLLTDFYQLTMAYGFFKQNMHKREAVFNLYFRKHPFGGGYTTFAGLKLMMDFIENFKFSEEDIAFLRTLRNAEGHLHFTEDFLDYLQNLKLEIDIDAQPEGGLVFPNEPLIRIKGPIIHCQLLETPLLTLAGYQSLIATKASRIVTQAKGEPVMEFGLRRAQGIDGALNASLGAYIGGCHSTSNVLAGKLFNIPISGTHAHSWVMAFSSELEAFDAFAEWMPENCILLVDTYDTLLGVKNAINIGHRLAKSGKKLRAIRIDSGDLAYLSIEARKLLDEAGLETTAIVGSNDLDEYLIKSLKEQDAKISIWGVGTKLVTSFDQPALGAVYKMSAMQREDGTWENKIKLSEQAIKVNIPGFLQVRRYYKNGIMSGDMIYDERNPVEEHKITAHDDFTKTKKFKDDCTFTDLLQPVIRNGKAVYESPDFGTIRAFHRDELKKLDRSTQRLTNPHIYPAGLENELFKTRTELIIKLRNQHLEE